MDTDIINVKWTWQTDASGKVPAGKRVPVEVPNDLIDTSVRGTSNQKLKDFITIQASPLQISFKAKDKTDKDAYLNIKGMMFDSYYNHIRVGLKVPGGIDFKGLWGLGERAYANFFYEDGVYTMWARD